MDSIRNIDKSDRLTILFLSWRDIKSPKKGGAEVFTHEMVARIDHAKYRIVHISPIFDGGAADQVIDGVRYLRMGKNSVTVIFEAMKFYWKNRDRIDYVVDQCNTHRFFTRLWVPAGKRIFFIHQLTREIWHLNSRPPISTIGELTETPFLRLSRHDHTITVSNSTRNDLLAVGFDPDKVVVLPEGLDFEPWDREKFLPKEPVPTFIYVGRYVHYKGIDDTVAAFAEVRKQHPDARLWLVGKKNEKYINDVLKPILDRSRLTYGDPQANPDVVIHGFVSEQTKLELMSRAHALIFPSQREGWGLIVTEAAAVGTPSIGYNSPGIVDAIDFGKAGYLCRENNVAGIVEQMESVLAGGAAYESMREAAYTFAGQFHWDNTAAAFDRFMETVRTGKK